MSFPTSTTSNYHGETDLIHLNSGSVLKVKISNAANWMVIVNPSSEFDTDFTLL